MKQLITNWDGFVAIARWLQSMVARLGWNSLFPTNMKEDGVFRQILNQNKNFIDDLFTTHGQF